MLGENTRKAAATVTVPIASALLRIGLTPNIVTIVGTVFSIVAAVVFFPTGHLFLGALIVTLFVLFDMFDGAMARLSGIETHFGGVLDSTCDRLTDGAVFASLAWYAGYQAHDRQIVAVLLVVGIVSQVISYVKARAQASGLSADGGFMERTERLIVILAGAALAGWQVPHALAIASWILLVGTLFTFAQRIIKVYNSERDQVVKST